MELWNDAIIDKSWILLRQLRKSIDFVLIGGWAVYLLTKSIKSKDIDIIIDFDTLSKLKKFDIRKNDKLKKYQIEADGIDIDIYIPYYSKLVVPPQKILKLTVSIEGFKVPKPEILLLLKQQAEINRENTVKGQKDRVDILSLLIKADLDFKYYNSISKEFNLEDYPKRLKKIVALSKKEFEYLGIINLREIKKIKQKILGELRVQ